MVEFEITGRDIKESIKTEQGLLNAFMDLYAIEQNKKDYSIKYDIIGFNYYDKKILTSFAEFYTEQGFLSFKQLRILRKLMYKYCSQVASLRTVLINLN